MQTTVQDGGMNLFVVDGKNNTMRFTNAPAKAISKDRAASPILQVPIIIPPPQCLRDSERRQIFCQPHETHGGSSGNHENGRPISRFYPDSFPSGSGTKPWGIRELYTNLAVRQKAYTIMPVTGFRLPANQHLRK